MKHLQTRKFLSLPPWQEAVCTTHHPTMTGTFWVVPERKSIWPPALEPAALEVLPFLMQRQLQLLEGWATCQVNDG